MTRAVTLASVVALVLAAAGSTAAARSSLLGPKGEFSAGLVRGLEYDPARACYKPGRPFGDPDEFALQMYRSSIRRYLDCLQDAVDSDLEYAQAQIQAGHEKAIEELRQEIRRGY